MRFLISILVAGFLLAGCGSPVHEDWRADSICVDSGWTRVADELCPIGDDEFPGYPFHWSYHEYRYGYGQPYVMPYVGYPVERTYFIDRRPARVTVLNINRGSFAADPPRGQSGAGSMVQPAGFKDQTRYVDKASGTVVAAGTTAAPKANANVQRGGLGVKERDTKKVVNAGGGTLTSRKALAPPPKGSRPMSKPTKKK